MKKFLSLLLTLTILLSLCPVMSIPAGAVDSGTWNWTVNTTHTATGGISGTATVLPDAMVNEDYQVSFLCTDGDSMESTCVYSLTPNLTWNALEDLNELSFFDGNCCKIEGQPTTAGTYEIACTCDTYSKTYSLTVNAPTKYLDASGQEQECTFYTSVKSADTAWGTAGKTTWYAVSGIVSIPNTVTVSGDVHLILKDGAKLTVTSPDQAGICVEKGNSLTVYAQSTKPATMGALSATGKNGGAGIGGNAETLAGTVTINGGAITATGSAGDDALSAGIGDGTYEEEAPTSECVVTVNGGTVSASGSSDSGLWVPAFSVSQAIVADTHTVWADITSNPTTIVTDSDADRDFADETGFRGRQFVAIMPPVCYIDADPADGAFDAAEDTVYGTVQAAVTVASTTPSTIVMTGDSAEKVTVSGGQTITLDLNGCTLSMRDQTVLTVNGTLTVKDSATGGRIAGFNGVQINTGGTATITAGTIEGSTTDQYGVYVYGGTANISGTASVSAPFPIVVNNNGTLRVTGGSSTSNNEGNAVDVWSGTAEISAGKFDGEVDASSGAQLTIAGGWFSVDPTEYVANGYHVKSIQENPYFYEVVTVVCYIDADTTDGAFDAAEDKVYDSVQAAVDAAKTTAATVVMIGDSKENVTVSYGQTITLNLNGYMLQGTYDDSVISNWGALTIEDTTNTSAAAHLFTVNADGLWKYDDTATTADYTYNTKDGLQKSGTASTDIPAANKVIAVTGGCITGGYGAVSTTESNHGGGIYNASSLTICGGCIIGNEAHNSESGQSALGGGIYNQGALSMSGGSIIGNAVTGDSGTDYDNFGGGVYLADGTFTMTDGNIVYNAILLSSDTGCDGAGGGIGMKGSDITFRMEGGSVSYNTASGGGGMYFAYGTVTMIGGTISGNIAYDNGGGVFNNTGVLTLSNGAAINGNKADFGGGVYNQNGTITVTGGAICGNAAEKNGGGVYNYASADKTVAISDQSKIESNQAGIYGGGIYNYAWWDNTAQAYVTGSGKVTITGSSVSKNTAITGGGIYNYDGALTISGSTVNNNKATGYGGSSGGGLYSWTDANQSVTISDQTEIKENQAAYGGGIYNCVSQDYASGSGNMTITSSGVNENTAVYGGGIYNYDGKLTISGGTVNNNKATGNDYASGGGIYSITDANQSVTISDQTEIKGNQAAYGGGIYNRGWWDNTAQAYVSGSGNVTITGSNVTENTAAYGGGIYNYDGKLTISGGTINNNKATENTDSSGGGIYSITDANQSVTISDQTEIKGNQSVYGGGIYNLGWWDDAAQAYASGSGNMTITESSITNNQGRFGGGINNGGALQLTDTVITGNTITFEGDCEGAGIDWWDGNLTISGKITLKDNKTNGAADNLFLSFDDDETNDNYYANRVLSIGGSGLTEDSQVGISHHMAPETDSPIAITGAGTANWLTDFFSDTLAYEVRSNFKNTDTTTDDILELAAFRLSSITSNTKNVTLENDAMSAEQAIAIAKEEKTNTDLTKVSVIAYAKSADFATDGKYLVITANSTTDWTSGSAMTLADMKADLGNKDYFVIGSVENHTHNWTYGVKAGTTDTLVATCSVAGCTSTDTGITIVKPAHTVYGDGKCAEATIQGGKTVLGDITTLTIQYVGTGSTVYSQSTTAPTDVGTYRASITVDTDKTAYVDYTIDKADNAIAPAPQGNAELTYDGNEQNLLANTPATNGTVQYAVGTNANTAPTSGWSATAPKGKNAGTYYVWYKGVGDANHKDVDPACITVTMEKAENSVLTAPQGSSLTYNGSEQNLIANTPAAANGTVQYAIGTDDKTAPTDGWSTTAPKGKNAGTYYVWYKGVGDANHKDTDPECIPVTIEKAVLTIGDATIGNKIYDGTDTATVTAVTFSGLMSESLTKDTDYTAIGVFDNTGAEGSANAASKVTVTVTLKDTVKANNYTVSGPTDVYKTIEKASNAIVTKPQGSTLTYNGSEQTLIANTPAAANGTVQYAIGSNANTAPTGDWSTTAPKGKEADTYYVWYKGVGDANHKDTDPECITVTIAQAGNSVVTPPQGATLAYNGGEQTLIANTPAAANGTVQYALGSNANTAPTDGWSTTAPKGKNAGTYYVWYKCVGDANHKDVDPACITATIQKASLTIAGAEIANKTYDGTKKATVTAVTFSGLMSESLTKDTDYTVTGEFDNTGAEGSTNAASQVTVTVTLKDTTKANNYSVSGSAQFSKTIAKAQQTASAPTVKSKTTTGVTLAEQSGYGATKYGCNTENTAPDTWQDSTEFTELQTNTKYYFFTKFEGDENHEAAVSTGTEVTTTNSSAGSIGTYDVLYNVNIAETQNGTVAVDVQRTHSGNLVTLTVEADRGWTLETITVTDPNGKEIVLTPVTYGETYTFRMPTGNVTVTATFMEDNTMLNYFVDVTASDYYYDAVLWAAENGITAGIDNLHFAPGNRTTRAQLVTFLWRAAGCPEPTVTDCPFTDVPENAYYYKAVLWAVEKGITLGVTETTFVPNAVVTRAQTVTFLWRYNGKPAATAANPFTDVKAGAYYYEAVLWAVENSITSGTGATVFSPNAYCTRGQIVTFLYRSVT